MTNNSPSQSLVELKEIIFNYIDESMQDRSSYRRLYPIAMRGVKDLAMDVFMQPHECKLTVEKNMTVKMPEDCMKVIDVGILNQSGNFAPLKYDGDMSLYADTSNTRTSDNRGPVTNDLFYLYQEFFLEYYYVFPYNNLYGIPGGLLWVGSYKVDHNNGVILLNNNYCYDYVILKYLRWDCADNVRVPIECVESLISWIAWKDINTAPLSSKVNLSDRMDRKREYYRQKRASRMRMNGFSLSKANDVAREAVRLCVKA